MNTAQLIVVSYAALAVEGVLLFQALDGSPIALILAIFVPAAILVYLLKPHQDANKRILIAVVLIPVGAVVLGLASWFYGWPYYQNWKQERAFEAERAGQQHALEVESAEWAKANIPPSFQQQYRQRAPNGSWAEMRREWDELQQAENAAERAKQEQAAAEAKTKQEQAAAEAIERARIARRLKVGDRVWVPSDSHVAVDAGYYRHSKPRLYGTVVDAVLAGNTERYAIKWDEDWVLRQVTWVTGGDGLNLLARSNQ